MKMTASRLRQDIYRVLDRILETGEVVEIERRGRRLIIRPEETPSRLERLKPRDYLHVAPEDLVHVDWADAWTPSI